MIAPEPSTEKLISVNAHLKYRARGIKKEKKGENPHSEQGPSDVGVVQSHSKKRF